MSGWGQPLSNPQSPGLERNSPTRHGWRRHSWQCCTAGHRFRLRQPAADIPRLARPYPAAARCTHAPAGLRPGAGPQVCSFAGSARSTAMWMASGVLAGTRGLALPSSTPRRSGRVLSLVPRAGVLTNAPLTVATGRGLASAVLKSGLLKGQGWLALAAGGWAACGLPLLLLARPRSDVLPCGAPGTRAAQPAAPTARGAGGCTAAVWRAVCPCALFGLNLTAVAAGMPTP